MQKGTKIIVSVIAIVVAILIVASILAVLLLGTFIILSSVNYAILSDIVYTKETNGVVERCRDHLESDGDFINKYGNILSLETDDRVPLDTVKHEDGVEEHYLDLDCETQKAEFQVRVYIRYHDDTRTRTYRHEINKETVVWK